MKLKHLAAALALVGSVGAQAQTSVSGFSPIAGPYSSAYNVLLGGLSTLSGDVDIAGATTNVGVSLSDGGSYFSFDSNAANGFSFANLTAGSYVLQFTAVGTGVGAFGGYYNVSAVPEPQTVAMMLAGLGAMGFIAIRRRGS